MNSGLEPVRWIVFLALWRMTYETANAPPKPEVHYLIQRRLTEEAPFPRQTEWANKAIQSYTAAQAKKWQRWQEALFERVD
ncbi:MAG: hypothetical protein PHU23_15610 [Dehalococcoidales bacterium]|nr:hypothetical protein [Dehalococcoidales bacterium]